MVFHTVILHSYRYIVIPYPYTYTVILYFLSLHRTNCAPKFCNKTPLQHTCGHWMFDSRLRFSRARIPHPNHRVRDRLAAARVAYDAFDANVRQAHEFEQRMLVVRPQLRQPLRRRHFLAAQLQRYFEGLKNLSKKKFFFQFFYVCGQVVEVLHAAGHRVPFCPIGDAALARKVVARGAVTRRVIILGHVRVRARVRFRNVSLREKMVEFLDIALKFFFCLPKSGIIRRP